jgi:hypothetical protein
MRKTVLVSICIMLLTVCFTVAGSVKDLQYKDANLFWDNTRTINDNNVKVDADTVKGVDLTEQVDNIQTTVNHVTSMESRYLQDSVGGGMSADAVNVKLCGSPHCLDEYSDYYSLMKNNFALKSRVAELEARVNLLEKLFWGQKPPQANIDIQTAMNKAKETGKEVTVGNWNCNADRCYALS